MAIRDPRPLSYIERAAGVFFASKTRAKLGLVLPRQNAENWTPKAARSRAAAEGRREDDGAGFHGVKRERGQ